MGAAVTRTPDRRARWQQAVFEHPQATAGTKLVLLLLLASGMRPNGVVSVPRSQLARTLGVAPARITEAVNAAVEVGLLSRVASGHPGRTAVLQALVTKGTDSVPSKGTPSRTCQGADSAPLQADPQGSEGYGFQYPNTRVRLRTPTAVDPGTQRESRRGSPGSTPNPAEKKGLPAGEVSHASPSPDAHPEHPDDLAFLRAV